jgi:hypothetical protein
VDLAVFIEAFLREERFSAVFSFAEEAHDSFMLDSAKGKLVNSIQNFDKPYLK